MVIVMTMSLFSGSVFADGGWRQDSTGWWYSTGDSFYKNQWAQIGGQWYYFNSDGYMEHDCYRDGYWLSTNGAWDKRYSHGSWKSNDKGWWYEDNGWYPVSKWLKINGSYYYFDSKGYMEHDCYRDGCWLKKDGSWDKNYSHGTWKSNAKGRWYDDNGWYPKNTILKIDGVMYSFDASGYGVCAENTDVTGIYMMKVSNPQEDWPVCYRLELLLDDDKLGVLFTDAYKYNDDNMFVFFTEYKTSGGIVTADYKGELFNVKISTDGKSADVTYIWDDGNSGVYTGRYERIEQEETEYKEEVIPEPVYDPKTPNASVDATLAKAARRFLELPDDAVLTEEHLAQVSYLEFYSEGPFTLKGIEYFSNLTGFLSNSSYIKDISGLGNISSLTEIIIIGAPIDTIPDLSKCNKLTYLSLSHCEITDISPVTKIRSLKQLDLTYNHIKSIAPIKDVKNIENLNINENPIVDWDTIAGNDKLVSALHLEYTDYDFDTVLTVQKKARSILNEIITDDMSELEKEIAIYKKVQDLAVYDMKVQECPEMPDGYYILMEGFGVCADYAKTISLLLNMAEIECFEIHSLPGPQNGPDGHAWNLVRIDGEYYEIDATNDDVGEPLEWVYFNVSRAYLEPISPFHLDEMPYRVAKRSMMRLNYLKYIYQ